MLRNEEDLSLNSYKMLSSVILFFGVMSIAIGQSPTISPSIPRKQGVAKTIPGTLTPAQEKYNEGINHFNTATQSFDSVLIAKNITELQALASMPEYRGDPVVHNLIGYLFLTQNASASAVPELQMATQLKPDDMDARNNLGSALRQLMRYDEAAAQYQYIVDHAKVTPGSPDTTQTRFNLATTLGQAGHLDQSLALFGDLASANPDAATMKNYGFFLQKVGKTSQAADALRKSGELNPRDAGAWLSAGELYVKTGNNDEALSALNHALDTGADPPLDAASTYAAHFALGEVYSSKGNTSEGVKEFNMASAVQPRNAVPLYNAAVLQEQAGLSSEAETSYRSALSLDPSNLQIQAALGLLLADEGKLTEAATQLSQTAPNLPQDAKAGPIYGRLGDAYAGLKHTNQAETAWHQALALNPDDTDTQISLAGSYLAQKQYVSALALYDAAAKARPSDAAIQNGRGTAYQKLRQYPRALIAFRQALTLNPHSARIQNNVGVVLELLGKKSQAIQSYQKSLLLDPNLREARLNLNRFARN